MYTFAKRAFDLVVASVLLIGLSPLMAAIALAVRLGSRGPAIFAQERAGQGGRPFTLYKFRTMRLNADPFGPSPRSGDDPRVTPFGRWLREHSLDELPQLLNIVKGDMSLVGPRPLYVSQIAEWNERQRKRLLVKPGLTGLAQVSGRGSLTREQKLERDVVYVERRRLRTDLWILVATVGQVMGGRGIYEARYSNAESVRGEGAAKQEEQRR